VDTNGNRRAESFDRWWPRLKDVGAFLLGIWLLVIRAAPQDFALAALQTTGAIALLGVTASGIAHRSLERWIGKDGAK